MAVADNHNFLMHVGSSRVLWKAGASSPIKLQDGENLPANTVFAVPADKVRLTQVTIVPDDARYFRQTLPYLLEDDLIGDVEQQHFVEYRTGDDEFAVAISGIAEMEKWLKSESPLKRWIPECLCLPWRDGEWTLFFERNDVVLRWHATCGTRIEIELMSDLLLSLGAHPDAIVVYAHDRDLAMDALPKIFHPLVQWRQGGWGAALLLAELGPAMNLRHGPFAPRLPFLKWWQLWRPVLIVFTIALSLQIGADFFALQRAKAENFEVRASVQDIYRRANPSGAVVDVEKQLDRQIAQFVGGKGAPAFTPLLVLVIESTAAEDGTLGMLNYSGGEIRVNVTAKSFGAVERIREELENRGLSAALETSTARDGVVRARLRIASA